MKKTTQFLNRVCDGLYYFWYGYRRAKARDPYFKSNDIKWATVEVLKQKYPEYLKSPKTEPMKPNASVLTGTNTCKEIQDGLNAAMGPRIALDFGALNIDFPITGKVWIYNVSKLTHEVDTPTLGIVKIPGNTSRKRYVMWTSFPDVMRTPCQSYGDNGEILLSARLMSGKRFSMDLINPDNLGLDQSMNPSMGSVGRNLGVRGVFWSVNNPPKKAEVDAAVYRLETFYKDLLERAEIMYEASKINTKRVEEIMEKEKLSMEDALRSFKGKVMELTPEHHAAAEWFKVTTEWHPVLAGK